MDTLITIPLVSLDYSVTAIGTGVMLVALVVLAEFAVPEKRD